MYKYWQIVQKPQDFILRFGSFHTVTEFMSCSSYGLPPKLAVAPESLNMLKESKETGLIRRIGNYGIDLE